MRGTFETDEEITREKTGEIGKGCKMHGPVFMRRNGISFFLSAWDVTGRLYVRQ